ncbi:MAG: TetR/AcrR family transcriptional regulator [Verrucomicrobiota bacterium JB023]|nr:TetR/AcrR family transcriptional regulator [Verrucomicrobiota bacterium JB023]
MPRKSSTPLKLQQALIGLMWRQCYTHVTIDAICEEAGVKKGSFYHFYKSKTELTIEALDFHWETDIRPKYDDHFSASRTPVERLERWLQHVCSESTEQLAESGRILGCPFCNIGQEIASVEPEVSQKVNDIIQRYMRYLIGTIRDAKLEGLTAIRDAEAVARSIFIYLEGTMSQARIQNSLTPLEGISEVVGRLTGLDLTPCCLLDQKADLTK